MCYCCTLPLVSSSQVIHIFPAAALGRAIDELTHWLQSQPFVDNRHACTGNVLQDFLHRGKQLAKLEFELVPAPAPYLAHRAATAAATTTIATRAEHGILASVDARVALVAVNVLEGVVDGVSELGEKW